MYLIFGNNLSYTSFPSLLLIMPLSAEGDVVSAILSHAHGLRVITAFCFCKIIRPTFPHLKNHSWRHFQGTSPFPASCLNWPFWLRSLPPLGHQQQPRHLTPHQPLPRARQVGKTNPHRQTSQFVVLVELPLYAITYTMFWIHSP